MFDLMLDIDDENIIELIDRIFKLKLIELMNNIKHKQIFRKTIPCKSPNHF